MARRRHAGAGDGEALTHRNVLAIAVPIIFANVTTPLIGIVDTAVLGQLGDPHYIGAVAIGAIIFTMVYWAFGFLRMGTTGLTAQAEGAGNDAEVAATLTRGLLLAAVAGTALILLQKPIGEIAFGLLQGTPDVEREAETYFYIRIWSAPAALANYAFLGWFIGIGRAGTAMSLQLLLNGANAGLDALFVLGLGMDVDGVAIGTLMAEAGAAVAGFMIAWQEFRRRGATVDRARMLEAAALRRMLSVNGDIMIRTLSLMFAFVWFTAQSATAGDVTLAANAILMNLVSFAAYFLDGFAFAGETFVGQAIGAGRRRRFRETVLMTSLWAAAFSIAIGAVFWFAGGAIIDALTVSPEVRTQARVYLAWAAIMPVISFPCFQLDGIFIGATRSADMRNMALVSLAIYLAAWALLTPLMGNHGLWLALAILNLARGVTLAARYRALERDLFGTQKPQAA
ncbi:MAG: MATE family efflux transporter [Pseudomonadota bacterium]|nr:MATE family efflux transporter [Pseudomonadota bacterium]